MSESNPDEFDDAPPYTVLGRQTVGLECITTVILDGEIQEFVIPRSVVQECAELIDEEGRE